MDIYKAFVYDFSEKFGVQAYIYINGKEIGPISLLPRPVHNAVRINHVKKEFDSINYND